MEEKQIQAEERKKIAKIVSFQMQEEATDSNSLQSKEIR